MKPLEVRYGLQARDTEGKTYIACIFDEGVTKEQAERTLKGWRDRDSIMIRYISECGVVEMTLLED